MVENGNEEEPEEEPEPTPPPVIPFTPTTPVRGRGGRGRGGSVRGRGGVHIAPPPVNPPPLTARQRHNLRSPARRGNLLQVHFEEREI